MIFRPKPNQHVKWELFRVRVDPIVGERITYNVRLIDVPQVDMDMMGITSLEGQEFDGAKSFAEIKVPAGEETNVFFYRYKTYSITAPLSKAAELLTIVVTGDILNFPREEGGPFAELAGAA